MRRYALRIPIALTTLRAALGPAVVLLALDWPSAAAFAVCLTLAFLSDYFDGVIARRLGVATPAVRRLDSIADTAFYLSALFAAWYLHSGILRPYVPALLVLAALEVARYVYDVRKFDREASYHMWSSKLWGITLVFAFYALLVFGQAGWLVALAIYVGIVADLEGLAISGVLPRCAQTCARSSTRSVSGPRRNPSARWSEDDIMRGLLGWLLASLATGATGALATREEFPVGYC